MSTTMIPDEELLAVAEDITVWVATPDAPADIWSLKDAIAWVMRQPNRAKITLFRPPAKNLRAAWLRPEQIERLSCLLATAV